MKEVSEARFLLRGEIFWSLEQQPACVFQDGLVALGFEFSRLASADLVNRFGCRSGTDLISLKLFGVGSG